MGLNNSPATFQRMMELILRGLPWHICMVYLDDVLIYSRTFEDHLLHLEEVLSRIQLAGLKLNPKNVTLPGTMLCSWAMFMGFQKSSDQGRQFEADVIQSLCQLQGIKKTRTTAYNPRSDGMVERHNRTLIAQLAKMLLSQGGEWDTYVKQVAFAYSSSKHASTQFTRFYLMHGREARVLADVLLPLSVLASRGSGSLTEYASSIAEQLESAFSTARLNSAEAHERQKLYHDKGGCHRAYGVGALV